MRKILLIFQSFSDTFGGSGRVAGGGEIHKVVCAVGLSHRFKAEPPHMSKASCDQVGPEQLTEILEYFCKEGFDLSTYYLAKDVI